MMRSSFDGKLALLHREMIAMGALCEGGRHGCEKKRCRSKNLKISAQNRGGGLLARLPFLFHSRPDPLTRISERRMLPSSKSPRSSRKVSIVPFMPLLSQSALNPVRAAV